jgi:colanic acid/amylovoran biosynthesis glycosyltransferase
MLVKVGRKRLGIIMRLIYIVSKYPTLTETFVAREMEELVQMGQEIIICPLRPPKREYHPSGMIVQGAQVLWCRFNPSGLVAAQIWLLRRRPVAWWACWRDVLFSNHKLSRLHHLFYILLVTTWLARSLQDSTRGHIRGHFLHSEAVSAMWLSRMLGLSYSLTAHMVEIHYPKAIIARAVNEAAFIASSSQEVLQFLRSMRSKDLYLIRNGINLAHFVYRGSQNPAPEKTMILAIGALREYKGFDVLIQACSILRQRGISFICRIIGEGKERKALEQIVDALSLADYIQMPGAVSFSELINEFAAATILVMASKDSKLGSDGIPTVIIESMALGIPVVATRKAGIPELVRDGETGFLAEPNDPVSLAECISALLTDETLQTKFSEAGRKVVEREYDIRVSISNLLKLIQNALHN